MIYRDLLTHALALLDTVKIEPGRENRARMAKAEQNLMVYLEHLKKIEMEAEKNGDGNDKQGKQHDGADGHTDDEG